MSNYNSNNNLSNNSMGKRKSLGGYASTSASASTSSLSSFFSTSATSSVSDMLSTTYISNKKSRKKVFKVWMSFTIEEIIDGKNERVKCKECGKNDLIYSSANGTSSMRKHIENYHKINLEEVIDDNNQPAMTSFINVGFNQEITNKLLVDLVIDCNLPVMNHNHIFPSPQSNTFRLIIFPKINYCQKFTKTIDTSKTSLTLPRPLYLPRLYYLLPRFLSLPKIFLTLP
ncbi:unnamed protein product [Cunninghamella blakesleeana]